MLNPFGSDKILALASVVTTTSGTLSGNTVTATKTAYGCTFVPGTTLGTWVLSLNQGPFTDNDVQIWAFIQGAQNVVNTVTYPSSTQIPSGGGFAANLSQAVITFGTSAVATGTSLATGSIINVIAFSCSDGVNNTP